MKVSIMADRQNSQFLFFGLALGMSLAFPAISSQAQDQGLTLGSTIRGETAADGTALLVCDKSSDDQRTCNPVIGDHMCEDEKPLLCFLDIQASAPTYLDDPEYWSGGIVASTDEVSGNAFETISEAHAYCAKIFGKDWRVAGFHDGGGGIRAYGNVGETPRRFWVDIKTQPDATCWSR